ncbi:DUF397 domain-containing protein [Actinomadura sp. 7K507]|nr:DUF397 domain-containing protein [Actinomadura sp. 7K507]
MAALAEGQDIRDSKAPDSGHLTLSSESFAQLVARVKRGELHLQPSTSTATASPSGGAARTSCTCRR